MILIIFHTSAAPGSSQSSVDCKSECNGNPSPVKVTGFGFKDLISSCDISDIDNLCNTYGRLVCWDTSQVNNMFDAFYTQEDFNLPLECWDISQVTTMSYMFAATFSFNQQLDMWDVSQVSYMKTMFDNAKSFNQVLDLWDVSQVSLTSKNDNPIHSCLVVHIDLLLIYAVISFFNEWRIGECLVFHFSFFHRKRYFYSAESTAFVLLCR